MNLEEFLLEEMVFGALSRIASFHNHIDVSFHETLGEIPGYDDIDEKNKQYWTSQYKIEFPRKLRNTTFLLIFGHFEEMLHVLYERVAEEQAIELDNGFGMARYKPLMKLAYSGELSAVEEFQFLVAAQLVRNSLLHAAGRVSISKRAKRIENVLVQYKKYFTKDLDRVEVTIEGLKKTEKSVRCLFEKILNKFVKYTPGV